MRVCFQIAPWLATALAISTATAGQASDPRPASFAAIAAPFVRSAAGTTWVLVHFSPAPCTEVSGGSASAAEIWCFEGAGGDSTWPAGPPNHGNWDHADTTGSYDGWHLVYDPTYLNKGSTCSFGDDWMWMAKPDAGAIPVNGFYMRLVAPAIDVHGWAGGVIEYDDNPVIPTGRDDFAKREVRTWESGLGWSAWTQAFETTPDGPYTSGWRLDKVGDLTPFLGASIESLQVGWSLYDGSMPGDFSWGKHAAVNYLVDNVSIGSFTSNTQFDATEIELFQDTFSLSDPAHTAFLSNANQGDWIGTGGSRPLTASESLSVDIHDPDGVTAANVILQWSFDGITFPYSKTMDLAVPDGGSGSDEGLYRQIIGADDGSPGEDPEGTSGNGLIWNAGTTVAYRIEVTDDAAQVSYSPTWEVSVLPIQTSGTRVLFVDDARERVLDPELSSGYSSTGGLGTGGFAAPVYRDAGDMIEEALVLAGLDVDRYDVHGAGGTVQCEPRGLAAPLKHLGGYMAHDGTPAYQALIWAHGTHNVFTLEPGSFTDLQTYIDNGGRVYMSGDGVAFDLGTAGNAVNPTFLSDYFGASFASAADDSTDQHDLWVKESATLDSLHVYGDCPEPRQFDVLTISGGGQARWVYSSMGTENGRPAIIRNFVNGDSVSAIQGFCPSAIAPAVPASLRSTSGRTALFVDVLSSLGVIIPGGGTDADSPRPVPAFSLAPPHPNPTPGPATIRFTLPTRERAQVIVYDVAGRRVRSLVDATLDARVHVVTWQGDTDSGSRAASGIYFVRLVAGAEEARRKVVLLR